MLWSSNVIYIKKMHDNCCRFVPLRNIIYRFKCRSLNDVQISGNHVCQGSTVQLLKRKIQVYQSCLQKYVPWLPHNQDKTKKEARLFKKEKKQIES